MHHFTLARLPECAVLGAGLVFSGVAAAAPPATLEQMWEIIQQQQQEIQALKAQINRTDRKVEETDQKVEAAGAMIEEGAGRVSTKAAWAERSRFGGYGELHYNNLDSKEEVDFHRFVLYFAHDFNDWARFFSEVEIEHALVFGDADEDAPGEVELEQAYVEFDVLSRPLTALRAGIQLIPVGILNETHEPPTFFGVERNRVESEIIPTTWWEGAIGAVGEIAPGWRYDLLLSSGLNVPTGGSDAFRIRSGRQKVAQATAEDGAITAALTWSGLPGIELGIAGQYQTDVTQGAQDIDATLFAAHADLRRGPFGLRALYARWDLDEGDSGVGPATNPDRPGRDEQYGWYVEPSYRTLLGFVPGEVGVFARYSAFDTQAGADLDTKEKQFDVGFNYWPVANAVFKFDYQNQMGAGDDDGFNLGVGYEF